MADEHIVRIEDPIYIQAVSSVDPDLVYLRGYSAYEVAVQAGFEGTREEWLASLAEEATLICEGYRDEAEGFRNEAQTARDKAQDWAEEAEDVPVEEGKYSALHHAEKASDAQTAAETARGLAEAARDKAEDWAEETEDVEVEAGKYSAKHWAAKAEDVVDEVYVVVDNKIAQLAGEVSVKINNLIINGGFENPDLTNWNPVVFRERYDIAKNGLKSIGIVNSGGTSYTQYVYTEIPTVIGNIYYTSAWCYVVVASPNNRLSKYNAGGFSSGVSSTYNNSLLNEWQNNSILFTATAESTRILNGDTASISAAREVYYDNVITIDLTTAFGAGNEPTKEEFELLLATLGVDYFEGEITIPAQKIMQWQLKLIRENKNAIIALEGTII